MGRARAAVINRTDIRIQCSADRAEVRRSFITTKCLCSLFRGSRGEVYIGSSVYCLLVPLAVRRPRRRAEGYDTPAQQREESITFMVAKVSTAGGQDGALLVTVA